MINNCPAKVKLIDENSVIGDTLDIFNENFKNLESIACAIEKSASVLDDSGTGAIIKMRGGVGIVVEPESGFVTVSQSYSPPWHIGVTDKPLYNELSGSNRFSQQVSKSSIFFNYLNQIASLTPVLTGSESYAYKKTNITQQGMKYNGLVTLGDGRLLLFPGVLNAGSIYEPDTGIFYQLPVSIPPGYANGILLPDGRVCLLPGTPKYITIWNPQSNSLFTSNIDLTIPNTSVPYNGGTLLPDGRILLTPFERKDGTVIYDPTTDTIKHIYSSAFTTVGGQSFFSGCLSQDGSCVYLTPFDSTQMLKITLKEPHSVTFVGAGGVGVPELGAFSSSVLMPNGKIFLTPYNASTAAIYDPITNTINLVGNGLFVSGRGSFITSILLPDGRVCMVPYNSPVFAYYNFLDESITFSNAVGVTNRKYRGATVLEDGNIFIAPHVEDNVVILNPGYQQGFTRATVTGMFFKETL